MIGTKSRRTKFNVAIATSKDPLSSNHGVSYWYTMVSNVNVIITRITISISTISHTTLRHFYNYDIVNTLIAKTELMNKPPFQYLFKYRLQTLIRESLTRFGCKMGNSLKKEKFKKNSIKVGRSYFYVIIMGRKQFQWWIAVNQSESFQWPSSVSRLTNC